jgi:hypothetical protein
MLVSSFVSYHESFATVIFKKCKAIDITVLQTVKTIFLIKINVLVIMPLAKRILK